MQEQQLCRLRGSGGGTSSRPGSIPAMDLGFVRSRIAVTLFSLGVRLFLLTRNRMVCILFLIPYFLFFPVSYHPLPL